MSRRFLLVLIATTLFVPSILLLDGTGLALQLALGGATVAFLYVCTRNAPVPRTQILTAIAVATLGEVLLSIGWQLYDYAHAAIPLYVLPGHGLFYALATEGAQQPWVQRHERAIVPSGQRRPSLPCCAVTSKYAAIRRTQSDTGRALSALDETRVRTEARSCGTHWALPIPSRPLPCRRGN